MGSLWKKLQKKSKTGVLINPKAMLFVQTQPIRGMKLLLGSLDRWKDHEVLDFHQILVVETSPKQTSILSLFFKKELDWYSLVTLTVYKSVSKRSTTKFLLHLSKVLYVTRINWVNEGVH